MGYPIHFHELQSSLEENNALPIVSSERTTSPTGLFLFLAVEMLNTHVVATAARTTNFTVNPLVSIRSPAVRAL